MQFRLETVGEVSDRGVGTVLFLSECVEGQSHKTETGGERLYSTANEQ